jgi:hypothetical protein
MEGNSATGTHVIPTYFQLKELLTNKISQALERDSLYPMYHVMIKHVKRYLEEAMQCKTLVLAIGCTSLKWLTGMIATSSISAWGFSSKSFNWPRIKNNGC